MSASTVANAQDALGSGDALDANLSTTGRRNAETARVDYSVRNLLVTGNVAGGRGFRGSVGYTAASDFRDGERTVGSNDLYGFRADSAYSALSVRGLGNTYNQIRYGQELGTLAYNRATSSEPVSDFEDQLSSPFSGTQISLDDAARLDRLSSSTTFAARAERYLDPQVIGAGQTEDGEIMYISANSIRGIQQISENDPRFQYGLTNYDIMRLKEDERSGYSNDRLGLSFDSSFQRLEDRSEVADPGLETNRLGDGRIDSIVDGRTTRSEYYEVLQRISARYAEREDVDLEVDEELLKSLDENYRDLIEEIRSRQRALPPDDGVENGDGSLGNTGEAGDAAAVPGVVPEALQDIRDRRERQREEAEGEGPTALERLTGEERQKLLDALRHQKRVTSLSTAETNRFNELVKSAEESLSRGEFFWAERRFSRALRFNPGEPMATAGLGHAQLGAGTYATSSLTLRQLLTNHPEMIDITYDPSLLPDRVTLLNAATTIEGRLSEGRDLMSNGFLLAYIGHQLNDREMLNRGVNAMHQAEPDSALLDVLRGIWLEGAGSRE
ncbi:MAG: hypothetical protein KC983_07590 [Phycisphaerales bacterium]|nr:hypothetical protein [Phycisphaerales bacterium]